MEMVKKSRLALITNPGSSSRKYALYRGSRFVASLHFEIIEKKVECTLKDADGKRCAVDIELKTLEQAVGHIHDILVDAKFLGANEEVDIVIVRVAAPGDYFAEDHLVDEEYLEQLEAAKEKAPLHVPNALKEIAHFRQSFKKSKLVSVSDSAFHAGKPKLAMYYPFDMELADKYGIKRYGYHGLSVASVIEYMEKNEILAEKVIVCHIGSGSSVSAVYRGKSMDNSMGYSPLEGVMMATRSGSMDVAAALAIKRNLGLTDDELEKYLNKEAGLLGVSGLSADMRDVEVARDKNDERSSFALALYVHRIQALIGQMAAALNGMDALVFTATVGERAGNERAAIMKKLTYLGVEEDLERNKVNLPAGHALVSTDDSVPVYAIKTDEFGQMVKQANMLVDGLE